MPEFEPVRFYDDLADDYDSMTGFPDRFEREEPVYRTFIERFGISSAVDAGCGTGLLALLLAKMGVRVTASDISPAMLDIARRHAVGMEHAPAFVEAGFEDLHHHIPAPVDAVFCMGNSLVHLASRDDVQEALHSFDAIVKPDGVVVLQVLNYALIIARRERIQHVREVGENVFIRFYDFVGDGLRFNILTLHRRPAGLTHSLRSVRIRPILRDELAGLLQGLGFQKIGYFSNVALAPFDETTSRDLVIVASRR